MRVDIDILGEKQVARRFDLMAGRAVDMRPAFERTADVLADATKKQFDSQGKQASGGWQPLKAATVRRKQSAGLDPRILHATLRLRRSFERGDTNSIVILQADEMRFGTRVPYAARHQRGGGTLPQRRIGQYTEATKRKAVQPLQLYLVRGRV